MPPVEVPDLARKLEALRRHARYSDWESLARAFERSPKTIQGWATDDRGRAAGSMPASAFERFKELIGQTLPEASAAMVDALARGPGAHLEAELSAGTQPSLMRLIEREAIHGKARLFRRNAESGLIETEDDFETPTEHALHLGEWFRLEFPRRHDCPHALVLRHGGLAWQILPAVARQGDAILQVPGWRKDGSPAFMREAQSTGAHGIVCFQTPAPWPSAILDHAQQTIALDKRALESIAASFERAPETRRACFAVTLSIRAGSPV